MAQSNDGAVRAGIARVDAIAVGAGGINRQSDDIVREEPLEIRVIAERGGARVRHSVAVTMRTPGDDHALALGFLFSEGAVTEPSSIWRVAHCDSGPESESGNVVEVHLAPGVEFDAERFSRHVYTTSSCGVCGKTSIEAVQAHCPNPLRQDWSIGAEVMRHLPARLKREQSLFHRTGGLHAAGLFDRRGKLLQAREDVGRHNAVDKIVGAMFLDGALPAGDRVLVVSGRAGFELVQKALMAGIPVLAAVGAASSLAVEIAAEFGMTLLGFLSEDRFNIYAGGERITSG